MKRRDFIKFSGAAAATAMLPFGVLGYFNSLQRDYSLFSDYYNSLWADRSMMVSRTYSSLHQFNRLIEESNSGMDSCYIRHMSIVQAAPTVTEQDIVDEIKEKWHSDPETQVITCGCESNYGFENYHRHHMTIGSIKEQVEKIQDQYFRDVGTKKYIKSNKYGYIRYTVELEDGVVYSKRKTFKTGKTTTNKHIKYTIEQFAKEMIASRNDEADRMLYTDNEKYWLAVERYGYDNVDYGDYVDFNKYREIRREQRGLNKTVA